MGELAESPDVKWSTRSLHLSASQAELLESGARIERPLEYCAMLLGRSSGNRILVTEVVRLQNSDTRRDRFSIADREIRRVELVARELKREIVAIVHSHASGLPIPSEKDRRVMLLSNYPWVIVGFDADDIFRVAAFDPVSGKSLPIVTPHLSLRRRGL